MIVRVGVVRGEVERLVGAEAGERDEPRVVDPVVPLQPGQALEPRLELREAAEPERAELGQVADLRQALLLGEPAGVGQVEG